jgi:hypothetical protein
VFKPVPFSLAARKFFKRFGLTVAAACCTLASAQTAPQLLPYNVKLVAGGGTAAIAAGAACPVSGYTSADAYGDGCLATEIQLVAPRYATVDAAGNVFFSDYTNGLIRRVDVSTGVVSAVAGGAAASPAAGAACGTLSSTDPRGDGCLGTAVKLSKPVGLAFSPAGDLYFADIGYYDVRKIAATSGLVPSTGGVISNIAGSTSASYGYAANSPSGNIVAATSSYLDSPYDVAFDTSGNLYIAEEYKEALLVVNTNATTTTTVTGVSIPPGTIAKILGYSTTGGSFCPNSPASTNGCNYAESTFNGPANSSEVDGPYAIAFDPLGNVYFADEYYNFIGKISSSGTLTQFAGIQDAAAKTLTRATAGTFGIGSTFGIAADTNSNVYFTDASSGVIWRVDAANSIAGTSQSQYVVAGGAKAVCSAATDTYGDGCPAAQATFGSSGASLYAVSASPGIFGVNVDANSNLYIGDTITNLIREVSSGTQFGNVGGNQSTTQTVDVHFATSDVPSGTPPFTLAAGSYFTLGTPTCTLNSDSTTDCLLPITATPTKLGVFSGTLQVASKLASATFPLSGVAVSTPVTRTAVAFNNTSNCTGTTTFSTATPLTFSATITSTGTPTGTITFYANGSQIGTPQTVAGGGASISYTFATAGAYAITATYSGDSYFHTSTSVTAVTITAAAPSFSATATAYQQSAVAPGETGLYSFNVLQNVYTGTIAMACSGLPAGATCSFSPQTLTATGCSTTSTVALSVLTQQGPMAASLGGPGRGLWSWLSLFAACGLASLLGLRRRSATHRFGRLTLLLLLAIGASGMMACGSGASGAAATPAGKYTITVTATGSTGTASTFTVPLTVN